MKRKFRVLALIITALFSNSVDAQLFRTRDRMDNLVDFDNQKFSWGFFLAGNYFDYKIDLNPQNGLNNKNQNRVLSKGSASFGAGLIGKMRVNEYIDLRLEPSLQFVQRKLTFDIKDLYPSAATTDLERDVKSTYVDVPLLVEFHGNRWYNSRPYVALGVNYLGNLQSNENSESDNQQQIFRTKTHNFGYTGEIGIQFYFSRFKLTPAVRGTFFLNNELVPDNPGTPPYWAGAMDHLSSRAFMFVLKFE